MLNRRHFLARAGALGCSLAASPLVTPVSFAKAPWENRLVVIILRGGMDGLDVVQPYVAPEWAGYRDWDGRKDVGAAGGPMDLDGFFALSPGLAGLMPLWQAGELGFVHAVSTPYRDKRSHFDGQDILEAGTGGPDVGALRDGWLNRMLQAVPGVEMETAYAIGRDDLLLTRGPAQVSNWSPEAGLLLSPQAERLLELVMHDDPLFQQATAEAIALSALDVGAMMEGSMAEEVDQAAMMNAMAEMTASARGREKGDEVARFAAAKLRGETRIAAFSLAGFDTHITQHKSLPAALARLESAILTLRAELGDVWGKTAVVAMTEFGRTARLNGSGGTDHGTGGAMLLAGGAVRGGRVYGDWPGLAEGDLYAGRDLMPTRDVRAHAGWIMRGLFGLETATVEGAIFPGLEMGGDPRLLL